MEAWRQLTDNELVTFLKEGNRHAYTEIYHRYKRLLLVFALRRLENEEECKDLIHELFLQLWVRRTELTITSSLSAYLYTAVRNRILDIITHQNVSARYIDSFQGYINQGEDNTDHLVRHKELLQLIESEIATLPPKMRLVFELSRKTNLTRKEIADQLDLSEQTVKSHMQHALKILKSRLGNVFGILFL
ncbi:RNA polymerase sigma factor [Chitinophaga sp. sic0106]|uniref:RNA polymerase sigma factor n=1 Tax=Chitinophaga sp. sic0106 TaxID=2854785 RepID=UPI001C473FEF|nr:RNA polymerase sigma-70 factor [Chitinophaga sp. sic0106]MBV7533016.1 RNA polymerase sigma-70 factor [Chitinophaga sp. sic0106]